MPVPGVAAGIVAPVFKSPAELATMAACPVPPEVSENIDCESHVSGTAGAGSRIGGLAGEEVFLFKVVKRLEADDLRRMVGARVSVDVPVVGGPAGSGLSVAVIGGDFGSVTLLVEKIDPRQ